MRAFGKMTCSTATELKLGPISHVTRETTRSDASMALVVTSGMTGRSTQEIGERIKFQALESTPGSMAASTRASGSITTWRGWAFTFGTMAECTKASTKTIRSMASVFTPGRTDAAMRVSGTKESSTLWALIWFPRTTRSNLGCGRMGNASSGSMRAKSMLSTTSS